MNSTLASIDPFLASCLALPPSPAPEEPKPTYAKLPAAPRTGSPVPHLTSLYHFDDDGQHRDHRYPGNCGGMLIKDLLTFFRPGLVFDPMSGSGTAADVCRDLGIPCHTGDIHQGFDACDAQDFPSGETFDFIWAHPPYWRMKLYSEDPRDLSRAPTLSDFLRRYGQFIRNCRNALKPDGKLAILMGELGNDRDEGYVPLVYHTKRLAFEAGLKQHTSDIIRFSHGTTSSWKAYRKSFIPILHDVCMIFEKAN